MFLINGKDFDDLIYSDIERFISEAEESFFVEFKEEKTTGKDLAKEISAFANTYGGYIFIGIDDNKNILGNTLWTEQKIYNVFHDQIIPLPVFDIRKINFPDGKHIFIIRVDEGPEPPYITSNGAIYERISSSSSKSNTVGVNNSTKLSNMYLRHKSNEESIHQKISINDIEDYAENLLGYLDIGFTVYSRNTEKMMAKHGSMREATVMNNLHPGSNYSLTRIGDSVYFNALPIKDNKLDFSQTLPAHTNNFIEIMNDGSARMRLLLLNNSNYSTETNLLYPNIEINIYKDLYKMFWEDIISNQFLYAKKYERWRIKRQFITKYHFPKELVEENIVAKEGADKLNDLSQKHNKETGVDYIVTNDRIPKTGFQTIDKTIFDKRGEAFNSQNIINELFQSKFLFLHI